MGTLQDIYQRAVAKFGQDQIGGMCNTCGGWDGTLGTVPQARHGDLMNVLGRMLGSGAAIARAQADFSKLDEAKAKARREAKPNTPNTIDSQFVQDVFAKWNTKREAAEE